MNRIGIGYDIHPLVENRPLILGGIQIPFKKGLDGDSDADVLTHAIIDALLGALAKGDIGTVFGVGTPELMGISSQILLEKTYRIMAKEKFQIANLDATIIAQQPKLMPYIPEMRNQLAKILHTSIKNINLKSTTHKGLGYLGTGNAIAVYAITQLKSKAKKRP